MRPEQHEIQLFRSVFQPSGPRKTLNCDHKLVPQTQCLVQLKLNSEIVNVKK